MFSESQSPPNLSSPNTKLPQVSNETSLTYEPPPCSTSTKRPTTAERNPKHHSNHHHPLLLPLLCSTQLITQSSLGATLIPLQHLSSTFTSDEPTVFPLRTWFLASYALTVGTFVLAAGRLGDIYGHRRMILLGWAWFGVSSLACGFAAFASHAPVLFVVLRAVQGVAPAVLLANGLAVLGREFRDGGREIDDGAFIEEGVGKEVRDRHITESPEGQEKGDGQTRQNNKASKATAVNREMAFALFGCTAPVGCGIGALVGCALAEWAWWPWFFWGQGLVCIVLMGVAYVCVPDRIPECAGERMDWIGAVLGVGGLILVNAAWNEGPIVGWGTVYVPVILGVGIAFLVAFGWWEKRVSQPLFPPGIMNVSATFVVICVALGWAGFSIWMYYTFQFLELVRGIGAFEGALQFIPLVISGFIAALVTGKLFKKVNSHWLMVVAMFAWLASCLLAATAPSQQTYWANIFLSMIIMPWGLDISFPASTLILSNLFPEAHQGIAASLINTIVNYSVSIGLGIAGTVESRVNQDGENLELAFKSALWTSVGLVGLGTVIALAFALTKMKN